MAARYRLMSEPTPSLNLKPGRGLSIDDLMGEMTLSEKIGQLNQINAGPYNALTDIEDDLRAGKIGAIINQVTRDTINEMQRIAIEESRLGIPLLVGRDVIHGFETVFPIPLGQAASWNPQLIEACARHSALEASATGVNWTFAPMIDVSRDARWGRIAESFGEDPYLNAAFGVAMVEGFQGDDLSSDGTIAACAKHFAGYSASEAGRDYSATNIPENELRNIYLPPFKALADSGVATFMTSFGDLDGVPATGNAFLLDQVLRQEWDYRGLVVSDWNAVSELTVHGLTEDDRGAALEAIKAGVDMEMEGQTYRHHAESLLDDDRINIADIDIKVERVLRLKEALGLFDNPYTAEPVGSDAIKEAGLELAKKAAQQSLVLLQNETGALPLDRSGLKRLSLIGPMADQAAEQLGTWVFDGDPSLSVTPLQALKDYVGTAVDIHFTSALDTTRDRRTERFDEIVQDASKSDAIICCVGEEAILSGEAHCRADIDLPGAQNALIKALAQTGKPLIVIVMAGRPLTLEPILPYTDAVLYAWHPGSMAGPAIIETIFGETPPSGKLPVSFPKMVGQIPIYYNHKNTGRPPRRETTVLIDDIDVGAEQTSFGMTAFHLDAGFEPQFPFGFGLTYTSFEYSPVKIDKPEIGFDETLKVSVEITNTGPRSGTDVVQLYIRDIAASVTRPVKELKAHKRVDLKPGETRTVSFDLTAGDLSFYGRDMTWTAESGAFTVWIGPDPTTTNKIAFRLVR